MSRDEVSNPFCFWFSNREIKLSGYQQAYYTFFAEDCQTPLHLPYLGNEKNPMQLIAPNTLFCLSLSACSRQDDMCYVHIAQYY
jgi:hypothetical protein